MPGRRSDATSERSALVAIGNFDGVHRGHTAVLLDAVKQAAKEGLSPLVLTFDPHPSKVLGRVDVPVLTSLSRKISLIERIDSSLRVAVETFTPELAALSPRQFAVELLLNKFSARHVFVGQNFRFGRERQGDLDALGSLGAELGFSVSAQSLLKVADIVVSSSQIRRAISDGDVVSAETLLGRPHAITGTVVQGSARGRSIGVPTANLASVAELLPALGVYSCVVDELDGASPRVLGSGVLNVGVRPTFGTQDVSVEVHLFDFAGDLYGRTLRLHLLERLRAERKFGSLAELKAQLALDIRDASVSAARRAPEPEAGGAWY